MNAWIFKLPRPLTLHHSGEKKSLKKEKEKRNLKVPLILGHNINMIQRRNAIIS